MIERVWIVIVGTEIGYDAAGIDSVWTTEAMARERATVLHVAAMEAARERGEWNPEAAAAADRVMVVGRDVNKVMIEDDPEELWP